MLTTTNAIVVSDCACFSCYTCYCPFSVAAHLASPGCSLVNRGMRCGNWCKSQTCTCRSYTMPAPERCGHAPDARTWDIDTASRHSATDAPPGGVAENQHSEHSGHCLLYCKMLLIMEHGLHSYFGMINWRKLNMFCDYIYCECEFYIYYEKVNFIKGDEGLKGRRCTTYLHNIW